MVAICRRLVPGPHIVVLSLLSLAVSSAAPGVLTAELIWTAAERLTNTSDESINPAVAADPSGTVHVLWAESRDSLTPDELYYKRCDGGSWTLDEHLATRVGGSPDLTADPSGNVHVVWSFADPHSWYTLYYKRWDGVTWTPDERIVSNAGNHSVYPALAADPGGNVHLVWCVTNGWGIYYARWDAGSWTASERLALGGYPPALAADPNGNVHAVWTDGRDGNEEIYYKRWDGLSWTADERLTNAPGDSRYSAVAADPSGNVHVVWEDQRAVNWKVYYKRWDGVTWTPDELIVSAPGEPNHTHSPALAADPSGNVHVVWEDYRDGNYPEIYYKRWDGLSWTADERLTYDPWVSRHPDIGVDPSGNVHVVWEDRRDGNPEVYYKRGEPLTAGIRDGSRVPDLAVLVLKQSSPNPLVNLATTLAFALPTRGRTTLTIFDPSGRVVAQPFDRFADAGEYEVVWDGRCRDGAPQPSGVYFYRLESAGASVTGRMVMVK